MEGFPVSHLFPSGTSIRPSQKHDIHSDMLLYSSPPVFEAGPSSYTSPEWPNMVERNNAYFGYANAPMTATAQPLSSLNTSSSTLQ